MLRLFLTASICTFLFGGLINSGQAQHYPILQEGKWGLANDSGQVVIPATFDLLEAADRDLTRFFFRKNQRYGLLDVGKGEIIPAEYQAIERLFHYYYLAFTEEGKRVFDYEGQEVFRCSKEASLLPAKYGFYRVHDRGKWGMWHRTQSAQFLPPRFDKLEILKRGAYFLTREDSISSIWDHDAKMIWENIPGDFRLWEDSLLIYRVPEGSGWGLVNMQKDTLIRAGYQNYKKAGLEGAFWVRKDRKWGLVGAGEKTLIPPTYSRPGKFAGVVARVFQGKEVGLVNQFGQTLAEPTYQSILVYERFARLLKEDSVWTQVAFAENGRKARYNLLQVGKAKTQNTNLSRGSSALSTAWQSNRLVWFQKGAKWGLLYSKSNRIKLPPRYDRVEQLRYHGWTLTINNPRDLQLRRFGLVKQSTGEIIQKNIFRWIFKEDAQVERNRPLPMRVQYPSGNYAWVNRDGDLIQLQNVVYVDAFSGLHARACQHNHFLQAREINHEQFPEASQYLLEGRWGLLDQKGRWKITPRYDWMSPFVARTSLFKRHGKWGALNDAGKTLIWESYDSLFMISLNTWRVGSEDYLIGARNDIRKYAFFNQSGDILFTGFYEQAGQFHEGKVRVRRDLKWGYVDQQGKEIIQPFFREAGDFHQGRARVLASGEWFYINEQGKKVGSNTFAWAGDFQEGQAWVRKSGKYGKIDSSGAWAFRPVFGRMTLLSDGKAIVRKGKRSGLLAPDGSWLIPAKYTSIQSRQGQIYAFKKGKSFRWNEQVGELEAITRAEVGRRVDPKVIWWRIEPPKTSEPAEGFLEKYALSQVQEPHDGIRGGFWQGQIGMLNLKGEEKLKLEYDYIQQIGNRIQVRQNGKIGYINENGEWVVPIKP